MTADWTFATVAELGTAIRSGATSPTELATLFLERLDTVGRSLNADNSIRAIVDRGANVVLNESAARRLGFADPADAVGKDLKAAIYDSTDYGLTPITVIGKLFTNTRRPTTSGAPPSACSQYACESTTTGWAPGCSSSSSWMSRPCAALTPSTGK